MKNNHIYNEIIEYLKEKNWTKGHIDNTYCPGRKSADGDITCVMMSAVVPAMLNERLHLNVIVKVSKNGIATITLGVLDGAFPDREEIYRVDYDSKGWHIDSKKYNLKHRKINNIQNWEQAIGQIIKYEFFLPFQYLNSEELLKFTDPENIMK